MLVSEKPSWENTFGQNPILRAYSHASKRNRVFWWNRWVDTHFPNPISQTRVPKLVPSTGASWKGKTLCFWLCSGRVFLLAGYNIQSIYSTRRLNIFLDRMRSRHGAVRTMLTKAWGDYASQTQCCCLCSLQLNSEDCAARRAIVSKKLGCCIAGRVWANLKPRYTSY